MLNIFKTNTYNNAANYVMTCLKSVDQRQLDIKHTIIVPDHCSLEAEKMMLSVVGGSFNISVMTFSRLASRILPEYRQMNKQAGILAITAIITSIKDKLQCFGKVAGGRGFAESMWQTICQLKYCKITPEQLYDKQYPVAVASKMHDIALIYQGYRDLTQDSYVDSADKLDLLYASIEDSKWCADGYFYLYDFDNLTRQELDIVLALINNSKGVTIACAASDKPRDRYVYSNDIFDSVSTLARNNNIMVNIIEDISHVNKYTHQIGKGMFHYDNVDSIDNQGFAEIYQGSTRAQEVYNLACKVSQYIRQGARYRDIYVVTSDINSYTNAVATIFEQFGIPYFCDRQFCLADHAYVQFLIDYMTMCNNAKQSNILAVAKNPLLPFDSQICDFENYCYKYNISYRLDGFKLGKSDSLFANADTVRQYLFDMSKANVFDKVDSANNYVDIINRLIQYVRLDLLVDDFARRQEDNNLAQYAKVSDQVSDKLQEISQQVKTLLGDRQMTLEDMTRILLTACQSVNISVLPTKGDCVIFANMAKARKHDIKYLALLGCNHGCIPIIGKDAKLLTDDNLLALASCGINVEPNVKLANKRERFSLYQLLQEPSSRLLVSYTLTSGADNLMPATWIDSLSQLFVEGKSPLQAGVGSDEGVYSYKQAISELVANIGKLHDNQSVQMPYFNILTNHYRSQLQQYDLQKEATRLTINNGRQILLGNKSSSVSRICQYCKCPYNYYFRYGLNIQSRQTATAEASIFGDILHAVLEQYVPDMRKDESDDITSTKAKSIFERVMKDEFYQALFSDVANANTAKQLRRESVKLCIVVKQQLQQTKFVNHSCELSFGMGEDVPAVTVDYAEGQFQLKGKIDRIDVYGDQFIVIDYKSGSDINYNEKLLYIGHKLQLLVYLKAVVAHYKLRPAGFYYFQLHNKFVKNSQAKPYSYNGRTLDDVETVRAIDATISDTGKSGRLSLRLKKDGTLYKSNNLLTELQIDSQIQYCMQLVKKIGKLMSEGFVGIVPYEESCKYCEYGDICDFNDIYTHESRKVTLPVGAEDFGGYDD